MAERDRSHIFITANAVTEPFQKRAQGGGERPPTPGDRVAHGTRLGQQLDRALEEAAARRGRRGDLAASGTYVSFESFPGVELALESLEPRQGKVHPVLVSVHVEHVASGQDVTQPREIATVFIPEGKAATFIKKIGAYIETGREAGAKNANLIDRIQTIRAATLKSLWTDSKHQFPEDLDAIAWWEVWLRRPSEEPFRGLLSFAERHELAIGDRFLVMGDRAVALIAASANVLAGALDELDDLAELRRPHEPSFFTERLSAREQAEWVEDLVSRTTPAGPTAPAVALLDTGVDRTNPLLQRSLDPSDMLTCNPGWGIEDRRNHGTRQAGLALYGDLEAALTSPSHVLLRHSLESVKILPNAGDNERHLYGAITAEAVDRLEIQSESRRRILSLSVTAADVADPDDPIATGQPTAWSAAVDALSAGLSVRTDRSGLVVLERDRQRDRLFIVSAGNVRPPATDIDRSDLEPCEDPAQAWNAVTVGAYTDRDLVTEPEHAGWTPVALDGGLSPHSRTSVAFSRLWPMKPEIVMEGGNTAVDAGGRSDSPPSLQLLTTARTSSEHLLTVTHGTSAATASASAIAAGIAAEFPSIGSEAVRALLVHSARWTPSMASLVERAAPRKSDVVALLRRFGWGVPDLGRAVRSARDAVTLVVEDVIHPYLDGKTREMHLHDLPWPLEVLADLGAVEAELRVTLSYFIEPNAARRRWRGRDAYASHQLRFDLRRPGESDIDFRKRLNDLALEEEERRTRSGGDSGWLVGPKARTAGSLHCDRWRGTSAELADRGLLAVYPVGGWWKSHPDRDASEEGVRYALVVSIETPGVEADIWTPIANQVGIPIVT